MSKRTPYTYSVLRYRHDVISGECVNVGVVLYAPKEQYFDYRFSKKYGRLRTIFPDLEGKAFVGMLNSIETGLQSLKERHKIFLLSNVENSKDFSENILRNDDSSFTWCEMGSGLTNDPRKEVERLFKRFVIWHENIQTHKRTDDEVWRPVREKLTQLKMTRLLKKNVVESDLTSVTFDHTYQNGALHCYQPLSFDLSTEQGIQDKVAKWSGHLYHLREASQDFKPYFIVGKPTDRALEGAYEAAIEALRTSPRDPKIYGEEDLDSLVSDIEGVINRHDKQQSWV